MTGGNTTQGYIRVGSRLDGEARKAATKPKAFKEAMVMEYKINGASDFNSIQNFWGHGKWDLGDSSREKAL